MRRIIFPLLLSILAITAFAGNLAPNPGLDLLAIAKFCDAGRAEIQKGWDVGAFTNVQGFGDAIPCLKKVCDDARAASIEAEAYWNDGHGCATRDFPKIAAEARRVNSLAEYCKIPVYLNLYTEHQCKVPQATALMKLGKENCPKCAGYINNPENGGDFVYNDNQVINESHGAKPNKPKSGRWFVSWDGTPAEDSDVEGWKSWTITAEKRRYWTCRFNGRSECNDTTPRASRWNYPDRSLIYSLALLDTIKGPVGQFTPLELYKSHSENKGNKDVRAEKPVIIVPQAGNSANLLSDKNVTIETCSGLQPSGKPWPPMMSAPWSAKNPGHRFYCPSMGYQIAQNAYRQTGSATVRIQIGKYVSKKFNPVFRHGNFR